MNAQLTVHHALVGSVGDGEAVRGDLVPAAVDVHPDHGLRVDGVALVRVDDHTEEARVGLQACNF